MVAAVPATGQPSAISHQANGDAKVCGLELCDCVGDDVVLLLLVSEAMACAKLEALVATVTPNVSEADTPPALVAMTFSVSEVAVVGAVPVKVSVVLLNFSQVGSAVPFDCVAE